MPDIVTDVTIGCRLSDQMPSVVDAAGNSVCASPTCLMTTGGMCVCPRNQIDCSEAGNSKQCVWLDTTQKDDVIKSGKCIHKTEVLYNVLYKKLKSRGKKSLALSIYYNSKPAQGRAPYGPHGPFIVDAVGHYLQKVILNFNCARLITFLHLDFDENVIFEVFSKSKFLCRTYLFCKMLKNSTKFRIFSYIRVRQNTCCAKIIT